MSPPAEAPLPALRRVAAEGVALAPVHAALHVVLEEIDPGRVRARMPVSPRDPLLDAVLVLADFASGLAVTGTLGAGERIATLSMQVTLLGGTVAAGLVAHGSLEHRDAAVGVSAAEVTDAAGEPVARVRARNAVLPEIRGGADGVGDAPGAASPSWHPRPGPFALLVPVRGGEDGERDERRDRGEGDGVVVAHPDPVTANSAGAVQGGVLAGVLARALARTLGEEPQELTVTFVRAVPADGAALVATGTAEHTGRRLRAGRAALRDLGGRLIATGTGLTYRG